MASYVIVLCKVMFVFGAFRHWILTNILIVVIGGAKRVVMPFRGMAARFIRYIGGSYSNIVGFSIYDIAAMLEAAGWYQGAIIWASFEKNQPLPRSKRQS